MPMSTTPITIAEFEPSNPSIHPSAIDSSVPSFRNQDPSETIEQEPDAAEQRKQYEADSEPCGAHIEPLPEACGHAGKGAIPVGAPQLAPLLLLLLLG